MLIENGIKWIVADEGILFKSLKCKRRDTALLYQPHLLKRKAGQLSIIFRDRNLSDMIGFTYHHWSAKDAVNDFISHLENTYRAFKEDDILLAIAMDGENAWEYFRKDGHEFLELLYQRLSETPYVKCVTVSEYLEMHPPKKSIRRLAAGSWIYAEFGKWIGNPAKVKAWEWLAEARAELESLIESGAEIPPLAWKQMMICEGSDWFWWYGDEQNGDFDVLFRMHLSNFYAILGKPAPLYLNSPLTVP
jgi:alpha-amylase/alpha-mannosidase (GH57 family)